jgi:tetratricopeptide (TPR) repeat protein
LRELDNAEAVTRRANSVFARHSKGAEHLIIGLLNLGNIESFRGKLVPAVNFHKAALKLAEQSGIGIQVPQIYQSLAHCYLIAGKYDSARYASQIAIDLAKKSTNIWALFSGYHALMKSALSTGDAELAKLCFEKADSISLTVEFTQMPSALVIPRIQVLLANREYNEAARLLNAYSLEWESLEFAKNYDKIRQRQISFAQRENEAKLKLQSSIVLLQKQNLDRQQAFIILVSLLLMLLLILSLALHRANKRKHEVNQMLDKIVEARTRELSRHRDALQHIIDEENGRRARASTELVSLLSSLKGLLHLAKIDPGEPDGDYLQKAIDVTNQIENVSHKYSEHDSRKPRVMTS